jgi:nicotinamidase-related amidase
MEALIIVDAQNEFAADGKRPVTHHQDALAAIADHVERARARQLPIAWIRHYNKPNESAAFVPGTWGSELSPGFGPIQGRSSERLFEKDVFGAFTGTALEEWLRSLEVTNVLIAGFYTHMCVSTSVREGLVRGFNVYVDPRATGTCDLQHRTLGSQPAKEVHRTALLQLASMGATIIDDNADPKLLFSA